MRLIEKKILRVLSDIGTPLTEKELYLHSFGGLMGLSEVEFKNYLNQWVHMEYSCILCLILLWGDLNEHTNYESL